MLCLIKILWKSLSSQKALKKHYMTRKWLKMCYCAIKEILIILIMISEGQLHNNSKKSKRSKSKENWKTSGLFYHY